jgi:tetratricopeptide (TPR) repeat protein
MGKINRGDNLLNDIEVNLDIKENKVMNLGQLPLIHIDTPLGKRLKGLKNIKLDLFIVLGLFQSFINLDDCEENYILRHSLWFSGVITYGRCFTVASGRGVRLERPRYISALDESLVKTHDEIMEQRHKYIAHADDNPYEDFEVFGVIDPIVNKVVGTTNHFSKTFNVNIESMNRYLSLVNEVIIRVAEDEERANQALNIQLASIPLDSFSLIEPSNKNNDELSITYAVLGTRLCLEKEDYLTGIEYFNRAINLNPNEIGFYINRSKAFDAVGELRKKQEDLYKIEELTKSKKL